MAELLFEIWDDAESSSQEMSQVSRQADTIRRAHYPNAVCVHRFTASSTFDASKKLYAWNGYGDWIAPPDLEDHAFTDEEEREQQRYLAQRNG